MDHRLARAREVQAQQDTANAVADVNARLAAIDAKLDAILADRPQPAADAKPKAK